MANVLQFTKFASFLSKILYHMVVITLIFHTRVINNNTMVYDQVNTVCIDEGDLEMAQEQLMYGFIKF